MKGGSRDWSVGPNPPFSHHRTCGMVGFLFFATCLTPKFWQLQDRMWPGHTNQYEISKIYLS